MTIGELAKRAQAGIDTVRYYERLGLLPPPARTASGYRVYPEDAVRRLHFIQRAKGMGFSLAEIGNLMGLRIQPGIACTDVRRRAEAKVAEIDDRIRNLQAMKKALSRLVAACSGRGSVSACPILDSLDGKEQP